MSSILQLKNIRKSFTQGGEIIEVLKDVSLAINQGEIVALIGPSGSGKTTLLQIAGLLDVVAKGEVIIAGENYTTANDTKRTIARRKHVGFVYQFHHLLPEFDALENVMMPQIINGVSESDAAKKAAELLETMELSNRVTHRPSQLSGGQQQRVAVARAIANNPTLILADEPTGNLDSQTAEHVFDAMKKLIRQTNCGALIATHNPDLVGKMDRVLKIVDGVIQ